MTRRVVHVINTAEVGGGGEHLLALARGLAGEGFASEAVVGRDGPAAARLRDAGVPVTVLGPMGPGAPAALARVVRAAGPDLLHLHGSRAGLAGGLAARATRTRPVVYTAHAFAFSRSLPWPLRRAAALAEALTCRAADRVICLTRGDLDAARRWGVPTHHAAVIPNGIDAQRFASGADRRREFGWAPGVPVVGIVARLVPQKDPLAFVEIAALVARDVPEARFLVVGDGPLRPAVERAAAAAGLADRIIVTGFRADVPDLLATIDVVVACSLWEGLPLALLEAMAAGRAVVATDLPGHAEVVARGEAGVLVPPGDAPAMARASAWLLRDPDRRAALGSAARAEVARRFTTGRMVEATASLYRAALGGAA